MTRSELLGQDRHGNRYYAFDVLPGIVVERFVPFARAPPATELVPTEIPPPAAAGEAGAEGTAANGASDPAANGATLADTNGAPPGDAAPVAAAPRTAPTPAVVATPDLPSVAEVLEGAMTNDNHVTVPWALYTDKALVQQLIDGLHENVCVSQCVQDDLFLFFPFCSPRRLTRRVCASRTCWLPCSCACRPSCGR